jgi:motility quorum-sensing regulator / GCU-specific mRNA interferase toxin
MEKKKPTYDLAGFKQAFCSVEKLAVTTTALKDAAALGMGRQGIVDTIQTMERSHFYKSMTSHANSREWQDVYFVPLKDEDNDIEVEVYLKFTADAVTEFKLLSFKEKQDG